MTGSLAYSSAGMFSEAAFPLRKRAALSYALAALSGLVKQPK
eukprot:CAMPEP_0182609248 /NCGR_PEP_ID=MMETSP1330-20130603/3405_1 /TAXON_ID=464278 /ORGANISM="Picochlorum sp., Strain RCC944" /LENGTH=41 /DNA_ID= /DNA_START= /DNA_END= /DNA_ORIENTATION=